MTAQDTPQLAPCQREGECGHGGDLPGRPTSQSDSFRIENLDDDSDQAAPGTLKSFVTSLLMGASLVAPFIVLPVGQSRAFHETSPTLCSSRSCRCIHSCSSRPSACPPGSGTPIRPDYQERAEFVDGTGSPWFRGGDRHTRRSDCGHRETHRCAGEPRSSTPATRSSLPASLTFTFTRSAARDCLLRCFPSSRFPPRTTTCDRG